MATETETEADVGATGTPGPLDDLTDRQREVYEFILWHVHEHGATPTYREIAAHIGSPNPTAARCHVSALVKKGYLSRRHKLARGISPKARSLGGRCPHCGGSL